MGATAPFDKAVKAASAGLADDLSFRSQHAGAFGQKLLLDEDRSGTKSTEHPRFAEGMHPSPSIRENEKNLRATFWPLPHPTADRNIDTSDDALAWIVGKSEAGYDTELQNITTTLPPTCREEVSACSSQNFGRPRLVCFLLSSAWLTSLSFLSE